MKKIFSLFLFTTTLFYLPASAQKVDKVKFFEEESTVNATLEMDLKDLLAKKAPDRICLPPYRLLPRMVQRSQKR